MEWLNDITLKMGFTFTEPMFLGLLFGLSLASASAIRSILKFAQGYVLRWSKLTSFSWDSVISYVLGDFRWWFLAPWTYYFVVSWIYKEFLSTSSIHKVLMLVSLIQVGLTGLYLLGAWRQSVLEKRIEKDPSTVAAMGLVSKLIQAVFVILLTLVGLDNLGIDVKALVAGLGIGGIAIALAAQNVLGDLLASLSIVLDKPFVVGDFIVVGAERGTIENIGIKTTRLRSISGEELIFSNKDLLESRVHNFKRMWRRRIVHKIGVLYSTPPEVVAQIPRWIEDLLKAHPKVEFDRAHFVGFGDSSLDFEFVFFVSDSDYNVAADVTQEVLMGILSKFNNEGVGFAFPTRSLHIESGVKVQMS